MGITGRKTETDSWPQKVCLKYSKETYLEETEERRMEQREKASHDEVHPEDFADPIGRQGGLAFTSPIQPVIGHKPPLVSDGVLGMVVPCS